MRRFAFILIVLIAGTFVQGSAQAQGANKRPFTFEDMMQLKRIGGPAVSPDARWVLFSAMDVDLKENKKTTHLWLVPLAGGEARQLTSDAAGEAGGRWSPDGKKFLFVSSRGGKGHHAGRSGCSAFQPGRPGQLRHLAGRARSSLHQKCR